MEKQKVGIQTEYIKLDSLLKLAGVDTTGGQAKERIAAGMVTVNGEVCLMRGKKLRGGDKVRTGGVEIEVERA